MNTGHVMLKQGNYHGYLLSEACVKTDAKTKKTTLLNAVNIKI